MDETIFDGLTRPRQRKELIKAGVSAARLRGPGWQCTSHGFYLPAAVDANACRQRILGAAVRLPSRGAIGGWAASHVQGIEECDGVDIDGRTLLDVPLCVAAQPIRDGGGVDLWFEPLPESDVIEIDGVRFTRSPRTCLDRMRRASDLREAVVVVDQMTHHGLVTVPEMTEYAAGHAGWRGIEQARQALRLCDPMARNGWETRMRMVWMLDAGLPRPMCNPPVFDLFEGLLGYPDLLDPTTGTVLEYDGAGHRQAIQHDRDNQREEIFEEHGLVVARVSRGNLADPPTLAERMIRTRRRGQARDRRRDRWTVQVPSSWGVYGSDDEIASIFRDL